MAARNDKNARRISADDARSRASIACDRLIVPGAMARAMAALLSISKHSTPLIGDARHQCVMSSARWRHKPGVCGLSKNACGVV